MNLLEFGRRVEADPELHHAGVVESLRRTDCEAVVLLAGNGRRKAVRVGVIEANTWAHLRNQLAETTQFLGLRHITRIVGYYSNVQNWNRSKLAELRDRHGGDYALPARSMIQPDDVDDVTARALGAAVAAMECRLDARGGGEAAS